MAKFLFTAWPFPGHIHPNIAIGHALHERGHEVAFYTGAGAGLAVEREGFRRFPFLRINEDRLDHVMYSSRRVTPPWQQARHLAGVLRAWLLDTLPHQVADQMEVVDAWQPDVVVSDVTMWGAPLVLSEKRPAPVAISSFIPACMIPGPDAPPWGMGMPRPRNWRTRLSARTVEAVADLLSTGFRRRASAMRERYGLAPLPVSVNEFLGRMPLYLVPATPEFDYERRDLPPSVHYVGPLVWNKPRNEPPPAWLAEIPTGQPWVHVTEGTMHAHPPFVLRAAAKGLADRPMQVIMTTGKSRDPASMGLGPLASNVHCHRWVPHSDLLPRTDVMVTTGGGSTVGAGVQAGVPMVVVPNQWEKPENAQRVVEAGIGLRIEPHRCTPERLRAAVERILGDSSFRQNAQRLAAISAGYGGPRRAAELLEGLLNPAHA